MQYRASDSPLTTEEEPNKHDQALNDYHEQFGEEKVLQLAIALVSEEPEAGVDDGRDLTIPTGGPLTYKDVSLAPEVTEA